MSSASARRRVLLGFPAAVLLLRLASAAAPAEPMLFGVPFGLGLELVVVVASTLSLWIVAQRILPREAAGSARAGSRDP